jgi:hypothetical protein
LAITPAASSPTLAGSGGSWFHSLPLKIAFMLGMTPQALTSISTSRGRGSGTSTVSIRSGCPGSCKRAARMEAAIDPSCPGRKFNPVQSSGAM